MFFPTPTKAKTQRGRQNDITGKIMLQHDFGRGVTSFGKEQDVNGLPGTDRLQGDVSFQNRHTASAKEYGISPTHEVFVGL